MKKLVKKLKEVIWIKRFIKSIKEVYKVNYKKYKNRNDKNEYKIIKIKENKTYGIIEEGESLTRFIEFINKCKQITKTCNLYLDNIDYINLYYLPQYMESNKINELLVDRIKDSSFTYNENIIILERFGSIDRIFYYNLIEEDIIRNEELQKDDILKYLLQNAVLLYVSNSINDKYIDYCMNDDNAIKLLIKVYMQCKKLYNTELYNEIDYTMNSIKEKLNNNYDGKL